MKSTLLKAGKLALGSIAAFSAGYVAGTIMSIRVIDSGELEGPSARADDGPLARYRETIDRSEDDDSRTTDSADALRLSGYETPATNPHLFDMHGIRDPPEYFNMPCSTEPVHPPDEMDIRDLSLGTALDEVEEGIERISDDDFFKELDEAMEEMLDEDIEFS